MCKIKVKSAAIHINFLKQVGSNRADVDLLTDRGIGQTATPGSIGVRGGGAGEL